MMYPDEKYLNDEYLDDGEPNAETLEAVAEARAIAAGLIKTRSYSSAKELIDELTAEADAEIEAERGGKQGDSVTSAGE